MECVAVFVDMVEDDEVPCYDAVGSDTSFKEMPKVTFTETRRSATPTGGVMTRYVASRVHLTLW